MKFACSHVSRNIVGKKCLATPSMSVEEESGMGFFEKFSIQIIPANGTKTEINAQQQIEF